MSDVTEPSDVYEIALAPPARRAITTVEVRDQDSRLPRRLRTGELGVLPFALIDTDTDEWRVMQLAEAGRGLALVDALCDRLTWQPNTGGGKVVRCHWRLKTATDTARSNPQPADRTEG
jgi:hypothetical protein